MIAWNSDFLPSEDVAVSFEPSCRIPREGTAVAPFFFFAKYLVFNRYIGVYMDKWAKTPYLYLQLSSAHSPLTSHAV